MKSISAWQRDVHELAQRKGWHESPVREDDLVDVDGVAAKLALVHSEISEAVEELRHGRLALHYGVGDKPEGLAVELADAVIRIMDLCEALDLDLEKAMNAKHVFNQSRPYRHGNKAL